MRRIFPLRRSQASSFCTVCIGEVGVHNVYWNQNEWQQQICIEMSTIIPNLISMTQKKRGKRNRQKMGNQRRAKKYAADLINTSIQMTQSYSKTKCSEMEWNSAKMASHFNSVICVLCMSVSAFRYSVGNKWNTGLVLFTLASVLQKEEMKTNRKKGILWIFTSITLVSFFPSLV